ncbi:MAG: carboxypeptidase-like regulatory domain-containing protein [Natrialbaceae archaeon]|nr:carboxypeptidase-like regulatory domain-containing protein [Natrialbaceae archaeon]
MAETQTNVTVPANGTATANFALTPAEGTITGTVLDDDGTPVANATVALSNTSTTTGAAGSYTLGVAFGNYTVTAEKTGYDNDTATVTVNATTTPVTQNFTLVAQNGSISGTATDQDGTALGSVTVTIDSTGQSAMTDANGTYTLANVSPGTYNLTASLANYSDATATNVAVGPGEDVTDVNVTLVAQNGSISGTITDADTGAAIDNASVTLETGQTATTGATGAYTITNVVPGTYNLTADHADYAPNTTSVTVGPNGSVTADLALTAQNGTITGTVTDADTGATIENATVTLETGQSATTDATGAYTIANVVPGTYNLTADHANYTANTTSVTVGPNETVTQDVALSPQNGSIAGTVVDQDGQPLTGATVAITATGQSATTDGSGAYTISNVAPGSYNLTASLAGYDGDSVSNVTVSPAEAVTNVSFTLEVQLENITVALGSDWLEVGESTNATVTANYADNTSTTVTSNATLGSTDTGVATVDSTGLVTATGEGQANITAQFQNESAEVPITVANQPDPLPMVLDGALEVDGAPAPANVTIEAEINGTVRGSITTDSVGSYGGPNAGDDKLVINGTAADQNATISFYLNHSSFSERLTAVPTTTWSSGTTLEHNLSATTDPGTITGNVTDTGGAALAERDSGDRGDRAGHDDECLRPVLDRRRVRDVQPHRLTGRV